jgi:hypothetical protein
MKKQYFYSNCFIEALKAKLKTKSSIRFTAMVYPNELIPSIHFYWYNPTTEQYYWFSAEDRDLPYYRKLYFRGHIRESKLPLNS